MIRSLATLFLTAGALFANVSHAAVIVDTGPGVPGVVGGYTILNDGTVAQYGAIRFTTDQDWIVTDIEGWISRAAAGETGTVAIYDTDGMTPTDELYASAFEGVGGDQAEWEGATALSWFLPAGTYFAAFEVREGQSMHATLVQGVQGQGCQVFVPDLHRNLVGHERRQAHERVG